MKINYKSPFLFAILVSYITPSYSAILHTTDSAAYFAAGSISQSNDFEAFGNWGYAYPGDPWHSNGVTYNGQGGHNDENAILGLGINTQPNSRYYMNNYWAQFIQGAVDQAPAYTMLSFNIGYSISRYTPDANNYFDVDLTVHTNLSTYSATVSARSVFFDPEFYGFIATEGEYFTGFEVIGIGTKYEAIDDVTLGYATPQVPLPPAFLLLASGLLGLGLYTRKTNLAI